MTAARLHHTHLFASDVEVTIEFYRRWFDAEVLADHEFAGARNIMIRIGDGRLNIYDQLPRGSGRNAIHHLGLQVDDLDSLVAEMIAGGVVFRTDIRVLAELDYIMAEAPDGVLLELFEWKQQPGTGDGGLEQWFEWNQDL